MSLGTFCSLDLMSLDVLYLGRFAAWTLCLWTFCRCTFQKATSTHIQNKSSLDLDGLSLKFIKFIALEISSPLAIIFNLSLSQGIFPDELKTNRIVPIFKTGDKRLCDNYRPISLVSALSKILEKIVATTLTNFLEINKLLYEHQYGFQRGKSTEQNLYM